MMCDVCCVMCAVCCVICDVCDVRCANLVEVDAVNQGARAIDGANRRPEMAVHINVVGD